MLALADSGDGSGLPQILAAWDPSWNTDEPPMHVRSMGAAIKALVSMGLVVVYSGMLPEDPVMSVVEIEAAVVNPENWYYGEEGLVQVLWVSTTKLGTSVLSEARPDDVMQYFGGRRAGSRDDGDPLDER